MEQFTVKVGEKKNLKLGFLSFHGFVYCGMPNENVFSVSYKETSGYQGYALNLYFPKNTKDIRIGKAKFRVLEVSPEKITIELVGG
ncbi:hypothetical protein KY360_03675 [Candidatus Woesearchaeota archaeon]|nr:hypothetical protein [Candidatus Woesearchaeota archaeon]